jgi:RHS repeat-associated protein
VALFKRYESINGRILSEMSSGSRSDYLADALGSVTVTADQSQNASAAYRYAAYGKRVSATPPSQRFGWVGRSGYRLDSTSGLHYIRARHYSSGVAAWTTVDAIWPYETAYNYCHSQPLRYVDPQGDQIIISGDSLPKPSPIPASVIASELRKNLGNCFGSNTETVVIAMTCLAEAESSNQWWAIGNPNTAAGGLFQLGYNQIYACCPEGCKLLERILGPSYPGAVFDFTCNITAAVNLLKLLCRSSSNLLSALGRNWGPVPSDGRTRQGNNWVNCLRRHGLTVQDIANIQCPKCEHDCDLELYRGLPDRTPWASPNTMGAPYGIPWPPYPATTTR